MATLWDILKPGDQEKLVYFYKQQFGMKFIPPKRGDRAIECDTKVEDLPELTRIMEQAPNYSVDVQGREG